MLRRAMAAILPSEHDDTVCDFSRWAIVDGFALMGSGRGPETTINAAQIDRKRAWVFVRKCRLPKNTHAARGAQLLIAVLARPKQQK
jgi:hypothetical protein